MPAAHYAEVARLVRLGAPAEAGALLLVFLAFTNRVVRTVERALFGSASQFKGFTELLALISSVGFTDSEFFPNFLDTLNPSAVLGCECSRELFRSDVSVQINPSGVAVIISVHGRRDGKPRLAPQQFLRSRSGSCTGNREKRPRRFH